jgi:hypothetical protein
MVQSNEDKQPNYTSKFGLINIMSDEEKSNYKAFNDKLIAMPYADLMKLVSGSSGDILTSEQRDLVAWQYKIRELDEMKRRGIDLYKQNNVYTANEKVGYDPTTPNLQSLQIAERNKIEGMSLEALERAKKLVDETPVVITKDQMHNMNGGGINIACNKYIVVDDNGQEVLVNNKRIQEMFRKRYIKAMSEVTGFDFTKYNLDGSDDSENFDNILTPDLDYTGQNIAEPDPIPQFNINEDEYEDD